MPSTPFKVPKYKTPSPPLGLRFRIPTRVARCAPAGGTQETERDPPNRTAVFGGGRPGKKQGGNLMPTPPGAPPFSYKWILTDPEPNPPTSCPTCESINSKTLLFIRQVDLDPSVP